MNTPGLILSWRTVADLRQVELGEVPPLQAVRGVGDVAGHRRLAVPDGRT